VSIFTFLQSGDNEVLKRRRVITLRKYRRIIHTIRRDMPDASPVPMRLWAFPGETEEQFENTLALLA